MIILITNKLYSQNDEYDNLDQKYSLEINIKKKLFYANQYLSIAQKERNNKNIIIGYIKLAECSNFENAIKYCDSMIAFSKKNNFKNLLAKSYFIKGRYFYNKRLMKEALKYFLLANEYVNKETGDLRTYILYSIGLIKSAQGDYNEALTIYKECEVFFKEKNSPDYLINLYSIAETYNKLNRIKESEDCTKRGLEISIKERNKIFQAFFSSNQGKNEFKKHNYKKAIENLISSLPIFQEQKDFSNYAENCYYLGLSFYSTDRDNSIFFFKKVDSIFKKEKDIYNETINSYPFLIDYYKKKKNLVKVKYYSENWAKADTILQYRNQFIGYKLSNEYDIPELKKTITKLNQEKKHSNVKLIVIIVLVILLTSFFVKKMFDNNKKQKKMNDYLAAVNQTSTKNKEIDKQGQKENKGIDNIDQKVVENIILNLDLFEKELSFLNKNCTVEFLANEFNTNSNYLSRVINEVKGVSFPTYLNNLRIDYIVDLLKEDKKVRNYKIVTIAEMAGYNNIQSFSRAFNSRTKMNPSFFIKQLFSR